MIALGIERRNKGEIYSAVAAMGFDPPFSIAANFF